MPICVMLLRKRADLVLEFIHEALVVLLCICLPLIIPQLHGILHITQILHLLLVVSHYHTPDVSRGGGGGVSACISINCWSKIYTLYLSVLNSFWRVASVCWYSSSRSLIRLVWKAGWSDCVINKIHLLLSLPPSLSPSLHLPSLSPYFFFFSIII